MVSIRALIGQKPSVSTICNILLLTTPEKGEVYFPGEDRFLSICAVSPHVTCTLDLHSPEPARLLRQGQEGETLVSAFCLKGCDNCKPWLPALPRGSHSAGPWSWAVPNTILRENIQVKHVKISKNWIHALSPIQGKVLVQVTSFSTFENMTSSVVVFLFKFLTYSDDLKKAEPRWNEILFYCNIVDNKD